MTPKVKGPRKPETILRELARRIHQTQGSLTWNTGFDLRRLVSELRQSLKPCPHAKRGETVLWCGACASLKKGRRP